MESVVTATSEMSARTDLVVRCLMVVSNREFALGWLSLSALRAFNSTDATASRLVENIIDLVKHAGNGEVFVGADAAEILISNRLIFAPRNSGKSEARIHVGSIGHVSRDKGTLAAALAKVGPIVIADATQSMRDLGIAAHEAAEKLAKSFAPHVVEEFDLMDDVKYTKPHITEKPYGKAHRRRFRR